jgi:hypothetical protein
MSMIECEKAMNKLKAAGFGRPPVPHSPPALLSPILFDLPLHRWCGRILTLDPVP